MNLWLVVATSLLTACGNEVTFPGRFDDEAGRGGGDELPQGGDDGAPADDGGVADGDASSPSGDPAVPADDDAPLGKVPVFVAQGHGGRLMMSCDAGRSWRFDTNDEPAVICFAPTDCDHSARSAAGLTYAAGWFFAAFGHGSTMGTLRRSADGKTWESLHTGDSQGGVYFNGEHLVWMDGRFGLSADLGVTIANNLENVPGHFYQSRTLAAVDDVIIVSSDDPGGLVSRDGGLTWTAATLNGMRWGRNVFMARAPDGSLVTLSDVHDVTESGQHYQTIAYVAQSTDGGLTWNATQQLTYVEKSVRWAGMFAAGGTLMVAFLDDFMWTSTTGTSWGASPLESPLPPGWLTSGPIARGADDSYVTVTSVWDNYYAKQKALRSDHGTVWTVLDADAFTGGHPVHHIIAGMVDASACAP